MQFVNTKFVAEHNSKNQSHHPCCIMSSDLFYCTAPHSVVVTHACLDSSGLHTKYCHRVVNYCIRKRLPWSSCFARKVCKEGDYYEDLMRYLRKNLAVRCPHLSYSDAPQKKRKCCILLFYILFIGCFLEVTGKLILNSRVPSQASKGS
jgi:hypothetical protein